MLVSTQGSQNPAKYIGIHRFATRSLFSSSSENVPLKLLGHPEDFSQVHSRYIVDGLMPTSRNNIIAQWPLKEGGFLQARVFISTDFSREEDESGNFGYFRYVIYHGLPGQKPRPFYRGFEGCKDCPTMGQIKDMPDMWSDGLVSKSHRRELREFSKTLYKLAKKPTWLYPWGENATKDNMQKNARRVAYVVYHLLVMKEKFYHPD
jgi:hypothetical protein